MPIAGTVIAALLPALALGDNVFLRGSDGATASASDGVCSNYGTSGYHLGNYAETLPASSAPNGVNWTWEQCAAECCSRFLYQCHFWTLQLNGDGGCLMMTNQGAYSNTGGHIEGDRDEDCCGTPPPSPGAWEFTWSDEFDGADGDPLDSNTWGYETGYVRNNEAQYYSERLENSRIDGGHALIEARRDNWNGHQYTSASRTTRGKKSFLYGRFSLRAKIDVRDGSWPAWWWLPDTGGWPRGGEIDMMEYYQWKLLFNVMDGDQTWSTVDPSLDNFGGAEFAKHFHTWTFDWSPDKIKLYLDGVLMNDYDVANADGTGPSNENPFRRPGYLLMNQAIGGTAGGDPSNTGFPVRYRIDWVRQWTWDEAVTDGISVTVNDGAGAGVYKPGTAATVAAGQPQVGEVFGSWTVVSGDVTLDDPSAETTTFVVPAGGSGDVILEANFVQGSPPTESPVAGPTPPPIDPQDGVCSKYSTTGWHTGTYEKVMEPTEAPDGLGWTWEECARECALYQTCEYWTLQLAGEGKCHLMSGQGTYNPTHSHAEGDKDLDCAVDLTAPPTMPPTMSPSQPPTQPQTLPPTQSPTMPPTQPPTKEPTSFPTSLPTTFQCSTITSKIPCNDDSRCKWAGKGVNECQKDDGGTGGSCTEGGILCDENCCNGCQSGNGPNAGNCKF